MKITVFGAGYVGLVQAAVLADIGHDVVSVDRDAALIAALERNLVPLYEPGLEHLIAEGQKSGRLRFTTDAGLGVAHARIQFIAVGTPPASDGRADISAVMAVADAIARNAQNSQLIVIKSTVPVGTTELVGRHIAARLTAHHPEGIRLEVASNPEFLKEGSAVADCARPDRIVIGTASQRAEDILREIYAPLNRNHEKILTMDIRSAELTKYAANAMLATRVSLMNEMANLADRLGADIERIRRGIGSDPRIGYDFLYAGIGFGGSCFPKDLSALIAAAETVGLEPHILRAVLRRNEAQKLFLLDKIVQYFGTDLSDRTFALWGLAFKPNTDDIRDSPACALLEALCAAGANVQAFDPKAMARTRERYRGEPRLRLCDSQEAALRGADALVVATEWRAFQTPDFDVLREALASPVIFDGRNIYDPAAARLHGLTVIAVGRPSAGWPASV